MEKNSLENMLVSCCFKRALSSSQIISQCCSKLATFLAIFVFFAEKRQLAAILRKQCGKAVLFELKAKLGVLF